MIAAIYSQEKNLFSLDLERGYGAVSTNIKDGGSRSGCNRHWPYDIDRVIRVTDSLLFLPVVWMGRRTFKSEELAGNKLPEYELQESESSRLS